MSPEEILAEFSAYDELPYDAIAAARANRPAVTPLFLNRIAQYLALPEEERADDPALFLIVFLLGEWREKSAYRLIAQLFRLGDDELEMILGDALTEHGHKIMAAVFDGDPQPIYDVIFDESASEWARSRLFDTLVLLVIWGELDRATVTAFVAGAHDQLRPRSENAAWDGWVGAAALLGMSELGPKARAAIEDLRVLPGSMEYRNFEEDLSYALAHPDAPWAHAYEGTPLGLLEDEAAHFSFGRHHDDDLTSDALTDFDVTNWPILDHNPHVNAFRSVGRNDPCPCGSGKKYKKCCLLREPS